MNKSLMLHSLRLLMFGWVIGDYVFEGRLTVTPYLGWQIAIAEFAFLPSTQV